MLESLAKVISVHGRQALVEPVEIGGCGKCDSAGGCGSSKLSQLLRVKPRRFRVQNEADVQVGSMVQVTLEEGVLLRSAMLMYLLPLVFLLLGAISGLHWASEWHRDAYSALGGLCGLISGFVVVQFWSKRQGFISVAEPVILIASNTGS